MRATGVACLSVALWATDARAGVAETTMPGAIQLGTAQQQSRITGTVADESGRPVVGATVIVAGTNRAVIAEADGIFSIEASPNETLQVSFYGYETQTIALDGRTSLNVTLAADAQMVEEVVIVGYGVQRKSVVTAAISSVKASDLETQTPSRMEAMLQGKVSGVTIIRDSGQPGAGSMVRIRGVGTYNNSNPLYVVDGMQLGSGDGIDQINPTDIESIEVLKDAASAAIYGTRGANGVILVTTKRGRTGDARVTYDAQFGWQNPWKQRDMLNESDYMTLMGEALQNSNLDIEDVPMLNKYVNGSVKHDTDWQKELFYANAPVTNHQASVSGASDRVNYYVSLGFFNQDGIVGGNYGRSNYDRMSIRTNNTYKLMDKSDSRNFLAKANLGINATYAHTNKTDIGTNGVNGSPLFNALALPPIEPVYADDPDAVIAQAANSYPGLPVLTDSEGRVFNPTDGYGEVRNPLSGMVLPGRKNWADKFVASFWADLEIFKGLTFRSSYGVDMAFWGWNQYSRPYWRNSEERSILTDSSASAQFNRGFTWQLENTLTWTEQFGKHGLTVLLGQSARANRNSTNLEGSKKNLIGIVPDIPYAYGDKAYINFATDPMGTVSGGPVDPYRLASYFGRVSYNFDERYMFEATVRRDGSSRFGATNHWAIFPSVSLGWNITNEEFAQSFPSWISSLKLRGSWGQNGNDNIGAFSYTSTMGFGNSNKYIWGSSGGLGDYQIGTQPNRIPNEDLRWETSEQIDLGIDASLFRGSLNVSVDWYQKNTKDMLLEMQMPKYIGNSLPQGNLGNMYNSGFEFEVNYRKSYGKWNFGVIANASTLKNEVRNLGNAAGFRNVGFTNDNWGPGNFRRDENGYPYHYFWGLKTNGVFQNQSQIDSYVNGEGEKLQPKAEPGDVIFVDHNNDGVVDAADKTMIGNYFPGWTYSLTFDVAWNGIDMSMFWQGVADVDIFDYTRRLDRGGFNLPSFYLDRWHGEGTSNSIPRMTWLDVPNENYLASDLYVQNGAYLRLKSLQIGYTLPESLTKKAFISRLRVYFMAENLLTITKYRGFDPEVNEGVDSGLYPQSRTLSVGLNLAF